MSVLELLILALALSMDAFAVAVCKGLSLKQIKLKNILIVGAYFGLFQGLMPLIGYFVGISFADKIESIDHWIAFGLLGIIGFKMILESFSHDETEAAIDDDGTAALEGRGSFLNGEFGIKKMLPLSIATSIDALAVGVSFSLIQVNIAIATISIGVITFALSGLGVLIGFKFGSKYKSRAELFGGIVLVLIGLKILFEHLGIISF